MAEKPGKANDFTSLNMGFLFFSCSNKWHFVTPERKLDKMGMLLKENCSLSISLPLDLTLTFPRVKSKMHFTIVSYVPKDP